MQVDVRIAAQRTFLHLAVRDADTAQQQTDFFEVGFRLLGTADLGPTDDLQQRSTRAIEVDEAITTPALLVVQHLAGVFFEMGPDDANALGPGGSLDLEPAVLT